MNKLFLFFMAPALAFASCADSAPADSSTASAPASHTAASFYKRYEGTIAGQAVVVYLEKDDSNCNGHYYYTTIGKPIALSGKFIGRDSLLLHEYPAGNSYSDAGDPQLRCAFSGEKLVGEWSLADKKHPISLQEKYPAGAYAFEMKKYQDTAMLIDDPNAPFASSGYKIPIASGKKEDARWLNEQIKESLSENHTAGTIDELIKANNARYFADYRKDNVEIVKAYAARKEDYPYHLHYDAATHYSIRYNENGWVVIEQAYFSYTGGAHGNYGSVFSNYDVAGKKKWTLQDVVVADSVSLQQLLEQQFRKDYHLPAPKPLTEWLFEKHIAVTDNFYLNEKGLNFLYNPYEVAPYAVGQIEVFVPYTLLNPYLTAAFKKRITGSK